MNRLPTIGCESFYQSSIINHQSSIINHQSSTINNQSSITNHQSSIINHQPSTIYHKPSILNPQSSITNHQSSIINHQSSIINHQPSAFFPPYSAACLTERQVPRPRTKKSRSQKGKSTQEIQSWAGYGPGKRLGVVEASGCWAKSCPKGGRSSSPVIALEGGIESREAA
jgi:hypothetical protein